MIIIKYIEMNQISTLSNPYCVEMSLNRINQI